MARLTPIGEATSGAFAAAFANFVVFPLDVIAARAQVPVSSDVAGLYSGVWTSISQTVLSSFLYFYFYSLLASGSRKGSTLSQLALGAAAGACSRFFTNPVSVIVTRLQTGLEKNIYSVAKDIVQTHGILGLWRGYPASLVLTINPAITYGFFERLKFLYLKIDYRKQHLTAAESFVLGAFTKALATIATYPYIMAKIRMQWKPPKTNSNEVTYTYRNATDILYKVYRTQGVLGWYVGLQAQLLKAVLCQGILFLTKDQIALLTLKLLKLWKRGGL